MARTEIVRQLWAYIRRNDLQDPNNKRKIICNEELRLVFETDCTDMFKMNKLLAKHIRPLEPTKDSNRDLKKLKPVEEEPSPPAEVDATNQLPVIVSDALANFFGTGEREVPHSEAVKRVWEHIKSNNLEIALSSSWFVVYPQAAAPPAGEAGIRRWRWEALLHGLDLPVVELTRLMTWRGASVTCR